MSLLDLPILVFRFPRDTKDEQNSLIMEIDATGDICLKLPDRIDKSVEAVEVFSIFWEGNDQRKVMKLIHQMFNNWQNPSHLFFNWNHYYQKRFKEEFKVTLFDWTTTIEEFFKDPFKSLTEKRSLQNITVLEVITMSINSSEPFMTTKIDWKGDFSQIVVPIAIGRDDVFSCHMKGVELALFIKAVLQDFLVRLLKKMVIVL
jgi:hypothetical protein